MKNIQNKGFAPPATGFTLMETLVAVLLLSVAIVGPLTIASKGIQATTIAKDENTAFFLAQDAVEFIRFARDTNRLAGVGSDWLTGNGSAQTVNLSLCTNAGGTATCFIDSIQNTVSSCTADPYTSCPPLIYDSVDNYSCYYGLNCSQSTPFVRTIAITNPLNGNANEAAATVSVSWSDPLPHTVIVRENIFNWQ